MTKYTDAEKAKVIDGALQSIATGQSLLEFCKANQYPYKTVYDWLMAGSVSDENSTRARYEAAKEAGTHYLAQECLTIADELAKPRLPIDTALTDGDGEGLNSKVQLARLRIDTRLRLIGKWNRKDYGEKQEVDHKSSDGSMTPRAPLSPEAAKAINDKLESEF